MRDPVKLWPLESSPGNASSALTQQTSPDEPVAGDNPRSPPTPHRFASHASLQSRNHACGSSVTFSRLAQITGTDHGLSRPRRVSPTPAADPILLALSQLATSVANLFARNSVFVGTVFTGESHSPACPRRSLTSPLLSVDPGPHRPNTSAPPLLHPLDTVLSLRPQLHTAGSTCHMLSPSPRVFPASSRLPPPSAPSFLHDRRLRVRHRLRQDHLCVVGRPQRRQAVEGVRHFSSRCPRRSPERELTSRVFCLHSIRHKYVEQE